MTRGVTRSDVLWGFVAQGLNMGAGLLLLPVILTRMSSEDVALWFVFVTLASFAQLLEFGFQPTLARNAAYVYSGATAISATDVPAAGGGGAIVNAQLLGDLIHTSRAIYRIIALLAACVLLGGGTFYVWMLLTPAQNTLFALAGWLAFAAGYIANFYFGYFGGLLAGRGDVTQSSKVIVFSRASLIVLGTLSVFTGLGLLGLGLSSLASSLVGRFLARRYFYTRPEKERQKSFSAGGSADQLMRVLWQNARRLGAVHLGAFLIQRGNILIATSFLGLKEAASYGLTITLFMALVNIGMVVCNQSMPYMSSLQVTGDTARLRDVYSTSLISAVLVFVAGATLLLLAGNPVLLLIGSNTQLLPTAALTVLAVSFALELNHSVAANFITTTNKIPFVKAAVCSGIAITVLALFTVSKFGVWSLVLSQALVQLAYNNWKWPATVSKIFESSTVALVRHGAIVVIRKRHG